MCVCVSVIAVIQNGGLIYQATQTFLHKRLERQHNGQHQQSSLPQPAVELSQHAQRSVAAIQDVETGNDVIAITRVQVPRVHIEHPA